MRGKYPVEYFENPDINKPIQEIWDDIERFTLEILNDEPNNFHLLKFIVLIPPFKYKNKFIKGAFYSQGLDVILELYPQLKNIFLCFVKIDFTKIGEN